MNHMKIESNQIRQTMRNIPVEISSISKLQIMIMNKYTKIYIADSGKAFFRKGVYPGLSIIDAHIHFIKSKSNSSNSPVSTKLKVKKTTTVR